MDWFYFSGEDWPGRGLSREHAEQRLKREKKRRHLRKIRKESRKRNRRAA